MADFPGKIALVGAIALTPALLRWWWGRGLLRLGADAALPERLLAVTRRTSLASAFALALLVGLSPRGTAWTVPLLLLGRLVAAYPSRRALFEERWSLAGYLSFSVRLFTAAYGLWILVALIPILVLLGGSFDWLVGVLLAALLLAWNARTSEATQWLLRARPLDNASLRTRFSTLAHSAAMPRVRFVRVDLRGGALANAAALPSTSSPAVMFTDPLLARLDEEALVAICAHELAHHEYYGRSRVERMRRVNAALIISGVAIAPLARIAHIPSAYWLTVIWYLSFVAVAAWRARGRQRNETASDLRAVALCGDAEALIRGLTKLYTLARVPRRFDPQFERQATHPSLARRIRDIRRAVGLPVSTLAQSAEFAAPDGATLVTFQPDRVNWSEGEAASHSLNYAHLSEVRVATPHSGPPSLVVVERGGRRWTMALASEDVGRAQAVLDVVDGRLAEPPVASRLRSVLSRAFSALTALLALFLGHVATGVLAIFVAFRPSPVLLGAGGLGAMAAGAITIRDHGVVGSRAVPAILLMAAAAALLVIARAPRDNTRPARAARPLLLLAFCAIGSIAFAAAGGLDAVSLHQSARTMSAPLVLSMAVAGALLCTPGRTATVGAALAACVSAGVSLAASTWFLDRFGHDPFLVRGPEFKSITVNVRASSEVGLPFYASRVRLSPGTRALAVAESEDGDDETTAAVTPTFHVGRRDGALAPLAADDVRFVDDDRVLVLLTARDGLELREVAIAPPNRILWVLQLPPLASPRLSLNTDHVSWSLLGWNRSREVVRREGQVGDVTFRETRWPLGPESVGYISALAAADDRVTAVEARYEMSVLQRAAPLAFLTSPLAMPRMQSTLRSLGGSREAQVRPSRFGAHCVPEPSAGRHLVCSIFDGTNTRVVTVSAAGDVRAAGTLPGEFFGRDAVGHGWMIGWAQRESLALRLSTREMFRIAAPPGEWIADVGLDDMTFATIGYGERGSVVRVYSTDDRPTRQK